MGKDTLLPFCFPVVHAKKITAAFDAADQFRRRRHAVGPGGAPVDIADQLARLIPDEGDARRVVHLLPDILRARIFALACGYEDADDLDRLRFDPALKLAYGRLPDTGRDSPRSGPS